MKNIHPDDIISALADSPLFHGIAADQLPALLVCIDARIISCEADGYFLRRGSSAPDIFIVVEGEAVGERLSVDGTAAVINEFGRGDIFGDVLSGAATESKVDVRARTRCTAVSFALENLLEPCADSRPHQAKLLRNFIHLISDKYLALHHRVTILLRTSLRAKIARYLLSFSLPDGDNQMILPHNREEMAGFLGCERSALSRELSRMQHDGLIAFDRRQFTIIDRAELEKLGS